VNSTGLEPEEMFQLGMNWATHSATNSWEQDSVAFSENTWLGRRRKRTTVWRCTPLRSKESRLLCDNSVPIAGGILKCEEET